MDPEIPGGPSGTRTLDPRVKSPVPPTVHPRPRASPRVHRRPPYNRPQIPRASTDVHRRPPAWLSFGCQQDRLDPGATPRGAGASRSGKGLPAAGRRKRSPSPSHDQPGEPHTRLSRPQRIEPSSASRVRASQAGRGITSKEHPLPSPRPWPSGRCPTSPQEPA
jgi:hypothetical protein